MSCSWASRLISPVVDGSDDKTTTFTVLLFNFHLFPLDLPLHNWFLCAFICLPFTSIHLSPLFPWCFFCLFSPLCHELTSLFLILLFFLHISPFFFLICSLSVPLLPLVILPILWNQCSPIHLCPILPCSLICLALHRSLFFSLPRILTSSCLVFFMLFFSSLWARSATLSTFLLICQMELWLSIFTSFPPWMLQLSHRAELPSSAFQAFCLPALCAGALLSTGGKLKKKRTDLFQSAKRDK